MTQLVTRITDDLADALDALVRDGVVESRSDGVRRALLALIDEHRRATTAAAIVRGYEAIPQEQNDLWSDAATIAMINDESW